MVIGAQEAIEDSRKLARLDHHLMNAGSLLCLVVSKLRLASRRRERWHGRRSRKSDSTIGQKGREDASWRCEILHFR